MDQKTLRRGLVAAAAMNIGGVLLFSRAFTNEAISVADPAVMSRFGLLMILVWGLTYLAAATQEGRIRWLLGAFALEKLAYVVAWLVWMSGNSLKAVYEMDLFAGIFYSIYGVNDLVFMIFFIQAFVTQGRER